MPHDAPYESLQEIRPDIQTRSDLLERLVEPVMRHAIEEREQRVPLQLHELLRRRQQLGMVGLPEREGQQQQRRQGE